MILLLRFDTKIKEIEASKIDARYSIENSPCNPKIQIFSTPAFGYQSSPKHIFSLRKLRVTPCPPTFSGYIYEKPLHCLTPSATPTFHYQPYSLRASLHNWSFLCHVLYPMHLMEENISKELLISKLSWLNEIWSWPHSTTLSQTMISSMDCI